MRYVILALALRGVAAFAADHPIETLWNDLGAKRAALKTFHQEFDVTHTSKLQEGSQAHKSRIIIDWSNGLWREKSVTGSGTFVTVFNGSELLHTELGIDECTRTKLKQKDDDPPTPTVYQISHPDWAKASEMARQPCGIPGAKHECVVLNVPLKETLSGASVRRSQGVARLFIDTVTGLIIQAISSQRVDTGHYSYISARTANLRSTGYGAALDSSLFTLPANLKEVKQISQWDAARLKKSYTGAAAPQLNVKDMNGRTIFLADLRGKTVLFDFWTTWCPPCREDAPSIDKLYKKFGGKELAIVTFSVSEDRDVVEKFLAQHPHEYPVVLTTENELPRAYQIGVFPTYMVIDPDGNLSNVVEGEKGFGSLKGILKKAGMDTE